MDRLNIPGFNANEYLTSQQTDVLGDKDRWFFSKYAERIQGKEGFNKFKTAAYDGYGPEEVTQIENAHEAMKVAEQTAHMSDEEFEKFGEEFARQTGKTPSAVTMPTLRDPNWQQIALAAAGALGSPQHGFDILATPFQAQLGKQQTDMQAALLKQKAEQDSLDAQNAANRIRFSIFQARMLNDRERVKGLQDQLKDILDRHTEIQKAQLSFERGMYAAQMGYQGKVDVANIRGDQGAEKIAHEQFFKGPSPESRQRAREDYLRLTGVDLGEPSPLTPAEKNQSAMAQFREGENTRRNELLPLTKDRIKSVTKLNDQRAAEIAEKIYWMPQEKQVQIAKGYAQIDNLKDLIRSRGVNEAFKQWTKGAELTKIAVQSAKGEYDRITAVLNQLRSARSKEKFDSDAWKSYAPQIEAAEFQADQAKQALDSLQGELDTVRQQIQGGSLNQEKYGPPNYNPANPFQGDITPSGVKNFGTKPSKSSPAKPPAARQPQWRRNPKTGAMEKVG